MVDLSGYTLSFSDEFDTRSISGTGDQTRWASIRSEWRLDAHSDLGFGASSFVDASSGYDPFSVVNGVLTITARPDTTPYGAPGNWESGLITTQGDFSQTYGYFEMRADLSDHPRAWDAFWLLPDVQIRSAENPSGWQEIDVIEHYGNHNIGAYSWIHTTDFHADPSADLQVYSEHTSQVSGFHTYGLMWTATTITFYYDGVEVGSKPTPSDMHSPMFVLANLAVQQGSGGEDQSMDMKIDYIRVYAADGANTGTEEPAPAYSGTIAIAAAAASLVEGSSGSTPYTFNVNLSAPSDGSQSVQWSVMSIASANAANQADFMGATSGTLTFAPGQAGATIQVLVAGDTTAEGDENFTITLFNPSSGVTLGEASASGVILNDDGLTLNGGNAAETLNGAALNDKLYGWGGNDTLMGFDADDWLDGGLGADKVYGGRGDDVLIGGPGGDLLDGGEGADTASYITASAGVIADLASPSLNKGDAALDKYVSVESLAGSTFADTLRGGSADNFLWGNNGADKLYGQAGSDTLYGGAGADVLYGGAGSDQLWGGSGADMFVFEALSFSSPGAPDTICDFDVGVDKIDLLLIDAKTAIRNDQAFSFIGSNGFTGKAGELNFLNGVLSGDVNGDKTADFQVLILSVSTLSAGDFYL